MSRRRRPRPHGPGAPSREERGRRARSASGRPGSPSPGRAPRAGGSESRPDPRRRLLPFPEPLSRPRLPAPSPPAGRGLSSGLRAARSRRPIVAPRGATRPNICPSGHWRIHQCHRAAHRGDSPSRTTRAPRRHAAPAPPGLAPWARLEPGSLRGTRSHRTPSMSGRQNATGSVNRRRDGADEGTVPARPWPRTRPGCGAGDMKAASQTRTGRGVSPGAAAPGAPRSPGRSYPGSLEPKLCQARLAAA